MKPVNKFVKPVKKFVQFLKEGLAKISRATCFLKKLEPYRQDVLGDVYTVGEEMREINGAAAILRET
jgi:hypothetical protein